jgi:acetylornithine/N-succinyldiaminopimelate aminotransferase
MDSDAVQFQFKNHVLDTYGRLPLVPVKGQGVWLWDAEGKSYLDLCMGIAVCSLGHCHSRLVEAVQKQAAELMHVSNLYQIPQQAALAEEINEHHVKIPGKVFFSNSGAEANDGLIKAARRYGHRKPQANGKPRFEIITFLQSFHGRTLGAMSATGQKKIQEGFDPLLPGFRYTPFNDLEAFKSAISEETVAILLEPIQGEGGVNEASVEFLSGVAQLAQEHDLLLMMDEVQAGFGRCGEAMAWRTILPDLEPDAISWAKGMGGGLPIGAFWLSDREIDAEGTKLSSLMNKGSHGSTYGGNPLVCAASLAVLQEIREQNLAQQATDREQYIRSIILSWNLPVIKEIRGKGLLLGLKLEGSKIPHAEGGNPALHVVMELLHAGLLVPAAGTETIRLLPPLNITQDEIDQALKILHGVLVRYI